MRLLPIVEVRPVGPCLFVGARRQPLWALRQPGPMPRATGYDHALPAMDSQIMSYTHRVSIATTSCLLLSTLLIAPTFATDASVDATFVGKVSQGGLYEVLASKVAVQRAKAQDVKDLAGTEVHDHQLVNETLKKLADGAGIVTSPTLNDEFQKRLDALKSAAASGFDAAYVEDMKEIHDKDEKLFAQEAVDGSGAFKAFAHQTDLIVKRHIGALHGTD